MCFVRAMDSIELATFPAPELSQRIGVFPQLKIFCHNQDVISIDRKQNFIFNQQAWFFWTDFESNGFQEI